MIESLLLYDYYFYLGLSCLECDANDGMTQIDGICSIVIKNMETN